MKKFERYFYSDKWKTAHLLVSLCIGAFLIGFLQMCHIPVTKLFSIINDSTISLSAAISGFVFAGMSIFISMDGNKKMVTVKAIGKDNIIYGILIASIFSFLVSLLLMFMDINILCFEATKLIVVQKIIKLIVEIASVYFFLLGFIFFFSSLKLIYRIFE